jgi:hypothetical protein
MAAWHLLKAYDPITMHVADDGAEDDHKKK